MKKARLKLISLALATAVLSGVMMTDFAMALETADVPADEVSVEETQPEETTVPEVTETEPVETTGEAQPTESVPEETQAEQGEPEETTVPEETTPITETTTAETTTSTPTPTATATPAPASEPAEFDQSAEVNGITVSVVADKGVFPEDSVLQVKYINDTAIDDIVLVDRDEDKVVSESMLLDISVLDKDGNEVEPDTTKGTVKVQFFDERFEDKNLDATIYHIEENDEATPLEYKNIDGGVEATTDGFSYYTVEFTYDKMQYVLEGDSSISLKTILNKVGLEGEVTNVEVSDTSRIGVSQADGQYMITALKPFKTTEWMKVTINGTVYEIIVTDDNDDQSEAYTPVDATAGTDAYAILYDSNILVFQKGDAADEAYGTVIASGLLKPALGENENYIWDDYRKTITSVVFKDNIKGMVSLNNFFGGFTKLTTIDNLNRLDCSQVVAMNSLFYNCYKLSGTFDISFFDTSNVKEFNAVFGNCAKITAIDMHGLDLSGVDSSWGGTFSGCTALQSVDLSGLKFGNVGTSFLGWSSGLSTDTLQWVDVTNCDISELTSLNSFFAGCNAREFRGLATWDTTNITNFNGTFQNCTYWTSMDDIKNWNTSKVTNMGMMFYGCAALTEIDCSKWDTSKVTTFSGPMMGHCTSLTKVDISNWDLTNAGSSCFGGFFDGSNNVKELICKNWKNFGGANIVSSSNWFGRSGSLGGSTLDYVDVSGWDFTGCTSINSLFGNLKTAEIRGLETWDVSGITDFGAVFQGCTLSNIDISSWNMSSATTTLNIFQGLPEGKVTVKIPASMGTTTGLATSGLNDHSLAWRNGSTMSLLEDLTAGQTAAGTYTPVNVTAIKADKTYFATWPDNRKAGENDDYVFLWDETGHDAIPVPVKDGATFKNWVDGDGVAYTATSTTFPAEFYPDWEYVQQTATVGSDAYAVRYNDGTKTTTVVQKGNTPNADDIARYGDFVAADLIKMNSGRCWVFNYSTDDAVIRDKLVGINGCLILSGAKYSIIGLENVDTSQVTTLGYDAYYDSLDYTGGPLFASTLKSIEGVENWDLSNVRNISYMFKGEIGSSATPIQYDLTPMKDWDMSKVTRAVGVFRYCVGGDFTPIKDWDLSSVTVMKEIFAQSSADFSVLDGWDVSGVTDLSYAFYKASGTYNLPHWNTANVTNMTGIFQEVADSAGMAGLASWDTSGVTTMSYAFYGTPATDWSFVSGWDVSHVTMMNNLCGSAKWFSLTPFKNWNVSSVKNFNNAFSSMDNLASISAIKDWDTSGATDMSYMFAFDKDLVEINELNWDVKGVQNFSGMFKQCENLNIVKGLKTWVLRDATNLSDMFMFDRAIERGGLDFIADWDVSHVTSLYATFDNVSAIRSSSIFANWDVSNVKSFAYTFRWCSFSETAGFENWNTSSATNMNSMFYGCKFQSVEGLANWDVSHVTDMGAMFQWTPIVDGSGLANWNTGSVTSMYGMFKYETTNNKQVHHLTSLDFMANWDVSKVTNMYQMFYGQSRFTDLEGLRNWNPEKLQNASEMFRECDRLQTADAIGNWNLPSITNVEDMFESCDALQSADFRGWDLSHISYYYYASRIWSSCPNLVVVGVPKGIPNNSWLQIVNPDYADGWKRLSDGQIYNLNTDIAYNYTNEKSDLYYKQHKVTFYPMGGTLENREFWVWSYEDSTINVDTPVRTGYIFDGWYDAYGNEYAPDQPVSLPAGSRVRSLYAKWTAESYTLVLEPNRTGLTAITKTVGADDIIVLAGDTFGEVDGYHIVRWTTRSNGGDSYDVDASVTALGEKDTTVTLYAQWEETPVVTPTPGPKYIDINVHKINIITGEEKGSDVVKAEVGKDTTGWDHVPSLDDVNGARMVYTSFANDLDAVHYDGTGKFLENDETYYTSYNGTEYNWQYNVLTEERAQFVGGHIWEESEDGVDIYMYYYEKLPVRVHFAPQVTDPLSQEVIMYVDDVPYRDGEYTIWIDPDDLNTTYNVSLNSTWSQWNNRTPDWWLKCGRIGYRISDDWYNGYSELRNWEQQGRVHFNLPYLTFANESYPWAQPEIYKVSSVNTSTCGYTGKEYSYTYWTRDYDTHYSVPIATPVKLVDAYDMDWECYAPLNAKFKFYNYSDETDLYTSTYDIGSSYDPNLRQMTIGFYAPDAYKKNKVFLGWYDKPDGEGGTLICEPNFTMWRADAQPLDVETFNGVLYAHFRDAEEGDMFSADGRYLRNNLRVIVHDDERVNPIETFYVSAGYGYTFRGWLSNNNLTHNRTAISDPTLFLQGFYSEPNGQGLCYTGADADTVITDNVHIYAYWTRDYSTIKFSLYGSSEHPSSAAYADVVSNPINRFHKTSTSYWECTDGTKFTEGMIPLTSTSELYNFEGWYSEPNGQGTKLTAGYVVNGDQTFYAYWTPCVKTALGEDLDIDWIIGWTDTNSPIRDSYGSMRVRFKIQTATDMVLDPDTVTISGAGSMGARYYPEVNLGDVFSSKYDNVTYDYYVINPVEITGGAGIDKTTSTSGTTVTIAVDVNKDGTQDFVVTRTLKTKDYVSSGGSSKYQDLQMVGTIVDFEPSWPDMENKDDYLYVRWDIKAASSNNGRGGPFEFEGIELVNAVPGSKLVQTTTYRLPDTIHGDKTYPANGESFVVAYPKTLLDYETGRAVFKQTIDYTQYPTYGNIDPRTVRLSGEVTYRWNRNARNYGDYEFMIGRGTRPYGTTGRVIMEEKPFVRNTIQMTSDMTWFIHEAISMDADKTHVIGMDKGDLLYNTGAVEDYYMLHPSCGEYILTDDDYRIGSVNIQVDLSWRKFDDETLTYTNELDKTNTYLGPDTVQLWVKYAGSDEWVRYNTGDQLTNANGGSLNRDIYFDDDHIVAVQLRIHSDCPIYESSTICPRINILNSLRMHEYARINNDQLASSIFKLDGRVGNVDADGNFSWSHSFWSGWTSGNVTTYFDGNCVLDLYELAPDLVGDRTWICGVDKWNASPSESGNSYYLYGSAKAGNEVSGRIYMYNRSTEQHDWAPIDSGVVFILVDDETSLRVNGFDFYHADRSDRSVYPDSTYAYYSYPDVQILGDSASQHFTTEYVQNYKGTGKTLAIVRFDGLAQFFSEDDPYNMMAINFRINKDELDVRYGKSDKAYIDMLAIDTSSVIRRTNNTDITTFLTDDYNSNFTDVDLRDVMTDYVRGTEYENGNCIAYRKGYAYWTLDSSVQFGFNQYVANSTKKYKAETTVFPGEEITYRCIYGVDGNTPVKDIVIDSVLDGVGVWKKGYIPVAKAGTQTATPDVWYCLTENPDFDHIDADHGWTQEDPTGKIVYGLHADYTKADDGTDFAVRENTTIMISIVETMTNPEGVDTATCTSTLKETEILADTATSLDSTSTLHLEDPDLQITVESTPESGTVDAPKILKYEEDLQYRIVTYNNTDRTIDNIEVVDQLPEHMHYDINDILIGGKPIMESPAVKDVSFENNLLKYTIKSLDSQMSTQVTINSYVNEEVTADINNQAHIVSYYSVDLRDDQEYHSNITYHRTEHNDVIVPDPTGFADNSKNWLYGAAELILATLLGYEIFEYRRKKKSREAEETAE